MNATPIEAPDNDPSGNYEEIEEVFVYASFPDFNETRLITDAQEIRFDNICGPNPTCSVGVLEFKGSHEISLGMYGTMTRF